MEENQLIVIKQLPIITENLRKVAEEIDTKVNTAKLLAVTDENVKEIKKVRTELNKEFKEFEERRKEVKQKVLEPYIQFEEVYKNLITEKYSSADNELKKKIDDVENELKKQKEKEVKDYFEEYRKYKNIDFITFEQAKIKVGLSDSKTSLHNQAKAFIDRVYEDLNLINTREHKTEILIEYKQNDLNVSRAITTVTDRFKAIEEERKRQEEQKKLHEEIVEIAKESDRHETVLQAPIEEKQEEILTLRFTVKATRTKLKELKQFLENGGYEYE